MKEGYRTHPELMQAWGLLRSLAFHPYLNGPVCPLCLEIGPHIHKPDCLVERGQTLVVDPPEANHAA